MEKRTVILDTNFLLIPFQFKIDIFSELDYLLDRYSIIVSSATLRELDRLSGQRTRAAIAAKLAKKILEANKNKIEIVKTQLNADSFIEDFAKRRRCIVCTNDIELKKKIKRLGVKIITLKSKSKLGFV